MTSSLQPYENSIILPKYKPNLIYFKCYINDILGIWLPTQSDNTQTWENFKKDLHSWGSLNWVTKEPSMATNFLDLSIEIHNNKILTSTFQKKIEPVPIPPAQISSPSQLPKGPETLLVTKYTR
jgi:hypothetical protein